MRREVSEEDYYVGMGLDETDFYIGSTGCFQDIMGRYKRCEMGDYIFYRLFCVWEKISAQPVSDGYAYWVSVSGMRTDEGGFLPVSSGFFRGFSYTSFYLSHRFLYSAFRLEPIYQEAEYGVLA